MIKTSLKTLYDRDFAIWIEDTVKKLKSGDYHHVDWENLIEEVESLGRKERQELENRLRTLFEHALKRCYVPIKDCYRGWENTIKRTQKDIKKLLRDSPSLRNYLLEMFAECYNDAVENLLDEYDVNFPDICPFTNDIEALLTDKFWEDI